MTKEELYERKKALERERKKRKREEEQQKLQSLTEERDLYFTANVKRGKQIMELQQKITELKHTRETEAELAPVISQDECPYCLDKCDFVLSCGHRAHPECIRKNHVTLRQKRACAVCRAPLSLQDRKRVNMSVA